MNRFSSLMSLQDTRTANKVRHGDVSEAASQYLHYTACGASEICLCAAAAAASGNFEWHRIAALAHDSARKLQRCRRTNCL
jgi:hypothetical protein